MRFRQTGSTTCLWLAACLWPVAALAHDVSGGDKAFVQTVDGPAFGPFFYLGAKHMVTGYDHILFLTGVVMFLFRPKDVILYVSMFTVGHSTTLLLGVLTGWGADAHLADAIIGLSVVYKGVENLGWFARLGLSFDTRAAVLVFGLFHGMGLATKLIDLSLPRNGLLTNLIGFNIGVEAGQILVLIPLVLVLGAARTSPHFAGGARFASAILVACGIAITIQQGMGYLAS